MSSTVQWIENFSKSQQKPYWFNPMTGKSTWVNPLLESEQPPSKRARSVAHGASDGGAADVVSSSYQPPASGSAQDAAVLKSQNLPPPRIIPDLPPSNLSMWERGDIMVNPYLATTYKEGFIIDSRGVKQKFKDITNPIQGRHLYNLITGNHFTRTLEVGLAMGASAVWITQAHRDVGRNGAHYAIDPNQTKQYENMGEILVERCGLSDHLTVIEKTSYRALPSLLEQVLSGVIPKFHLIYIDGWHTFDYTLVDFFYADLLLEVNGVIVLDDIKHKPVRKCLEYIRTNYPHYEIVPLTPCYRPENPTDSSQATFIKTSSDCRVWNYHLEF